MTRRRSSMVSIDVDSLLDLYPDRPSDWSGEDPIYRQALPRLLDLLAAQEIPATLFVVGQDLLHPSHRAMIRRFAEAGHEVANHSMTHPQGFRFLSRNEKLSQITEAAERIADVAGRPPVGFRAPGWNVDEETLEILEEQGYLYDSSIFPSWTSNFLKPAYWLARREAKNPADRTTLGRWSYQFAPPVPYRPGRQLWHRGRRGVLEIPIATVPWLRLPFFGTSSLWMGRRGHELCWQMVRRGARPVNYQIHGADFADPASDGIIPMLASSRKDYIPQAFQVPWERKKPLLTQTFTWLKSSFTVVTLESFARGIKDPLS